MQIHDETDSYGWEGDGGLGLRLIQQIIDGRKTATCSPVCAMDDAEIREWHAQVGRELTITDRFGTPRCNVRITDCYETTLGDPDPRLVVGEGGDRESFITGHRRVWADWAAEQGFELADDLVLLAQSFELTDVMNAEGPPADADGPSN